MVMLYPTWEIVHSRAWKLQIPYLARHCRVVTFDRRGHERSDRPDDPAACRPRNTIGDPLAVLDEVGAERAVLVACCGDGDDLTL
jgi:pimeloyl-ACP methyl ester carboxylesterase